MLLLPVIWGPKGFDRFPWGGRGGCAPTSCTSAWLWKLGDRDLRPGVRCPNYDKKVSNDKLSMLGLKEEISRDSLYWGIQSPAGRHCWYPDAFEKHLGTSNWCKTEEGSRSKIKQHRARSRLPALVSVKGLGSTWVLRAGGWLPMLTAWHGH